MDRISFLPSIRIRRFAKKIVIITIIFYICIAMLMPGATLATQTKYPYTNGCLSAYAQYDRLIQDLKSKHPNWNFTILNTGLDWNEVIKNETVAVHGRNLIYYTYNGSWVCSTCGNKTYDTGRWKCASEAAVSYYMDPRNWLNENNIFQFENLAYNGDVQNIEGVRKILSSIPWANGDKVTYTKADGTIGTIQKSYAQIIMDAAKAAGISPYHLAARIKQEQGARQVASSTGNGNYEGYVGYYNFLNIKATGSNVIANALAYAKEQGWSDPEKSIVGGAEFIASSYIKRGQSTLYLQKFDVDSSDSSLYYHQYMQNVSAAFTEGNTVKSSYESMGLMNASISFVIPVYRNMPTQISSSPEGFSIVTQNVQITGSNVSVRNGKSTSAGEIAKLNSGDVVLRIEIAGSKENGYFWDKIVLSNGAKGYIARDYIKQVNDVTNAETSAVANANVNLRNGPGTTGTSVVRTLTAGQQVTIIETGKYNGLDGYNWSRVKLSNDAQGYVVNDYLTQITQTNYQVAYVNCEAGSSVRVRSGVGTGHSIITSLKKDAKVTVMKKGAGTANGFTWDKIVTAEGLEGYIANEYLRYESGNSNTNANDVDGNGSVNSTDLYYVIKFLRESNDAYDAKYDVNKDGTVNSTDLYQIIVYLRQN